MNIHDLLSDRFIIDVAAASVAGLFAIMLIMMGVARLHTIFGAYMRMTIEQTREHEPRYGYAVFLIGFGLAMVCTVLIYLVAVLA